MIIDFHTHCFPNYLTRRAVPKLALDGGNLVPAFDGTAMGLENAIKRDGADKAVVLNIATNPKQQRNVNNFVKMILDRSDVLIPFGSVHPDSEDVIPQLEWLHKQGVKGIKFHPDFQGFFVDDEKMFPIYEKIAELGMITVFHAGVDISEPDPVHCTPQRLRKAMPRFGDAPVVAAHMGGFLLWQEVAENLADTGCYLDTALSMGSLPPKWAKDIIKAFGAKRILFGSDMPWSSTRNEISFIKSIGLDSWDEEMILGRNAQRILGL